MNQQKVAQIVNTVLRELEARSLLEPTDLGCKSYDEIVGVICANEGIPFDSADYDNYWGK